MPRLLPSLTLGAIVVFAAGPAHSAEPTPDPWKTALAFDYNAAADTFAELHAADPTDTRTAIAYASALLVKQPRTKANILLARDLLLRAHHTAAASPDNRVLALYLLARVELDHLDPAQPDSARSRLEQLRRDHPAHALSDQAAVQLAYFLAYPPAGPDTDALPEIEKLLASVQTPEAARDLHHLLGSFHLRLLRNASAALPHFIAARAVGFEQPLRDAESDLTIANLARETGDTALARKHYAAFLAAAPRDTRADTVRHLLASPEAPLAHPAQ